MTIAHQRFDKIVYFYLLNFEKKVKKWEVGEKSPNFEMANLQKWVSLIPGKLSLLQYLFIPNK